MSSQSRRTYIIVALIIIVLIAFGIVVGIILYPYFTQKGITARQAKEMADEYLEDSDKTLMFYGVRTDDPSMIREGEFDYWYVDYHLPPEESGSMTVERYKVGRDGDVKLLTTLRHPYATSVPTDWVFDSGKVYREAKSEPRIKEYLKDNDDVEFKAFYMRYINTTKRFEWTLEFKNEGWKDIHRAEITLVDGTGEVVAASVEYK